MGEVLSRDPDVGKAQGAAAQLGAKAEKTLSAGTASPALPPPCLINLRDSPLADTAGFVSGSVYPDACPTVQAKSVCRTLAMGQRWGKSSEPDKAPVLMSLCTNPVATN